MMRMRTRTSLVSMARSRSRASGQFEMSRMENYEELIRETRTRVLSYADAQNWRVVKKSVCSVCLCWLLIYLQCMNACRMEQ